MSLLLYAIAEEGAAEVADRTGVAEAPVRSVDVAGLRALVSDHPHLPRPTRRDLWAFEEVVESEMGLGAVLPMRFGSLVADRTALEDLLLTRRRELCARLEQVRGAVELGVRGSWLQGHGEGAEEHGSSGLEYMRGRVAETRRTRELAVRLEEELGPLARAARHRTLPRPGVPVSAAYLVDRDLVREFTARVSELERALPDVELICSGPWPPYSFAEADPSE